MAYGFSDRDQDDIKATLANRFRCGYDDVHIGSWKSCQFFDEHQRVLAR